MANIIMTIILMSNDIIHSNAHAVIIVFMVIRRYVPQHTPHNVQRARAGLYRGRLSRNTRWIYSLTIWIPHNVCVYTYINVFNRVNRFLIPRLSPPPHSQRVCTDTDVAVWYTIGGNDDTPTTIIIIIQILILIYLLKMLFSP